MFFDNLVLALAARQKPSALGPPAGKATLWAARFGVRQFIVVFVGRHVPMVVVGGAALDFPQSIVDR
jgi:hypothetical protein